MFGMRTVFERLPSPPRCNLCASPFKGPFAAVLGLIGKRPFPKNPRFCEFCFSGVIKKKVGSEVEMAALFADVRGSTPMGERLGPTGLHEILDRFYGVGVDVLIRGGAIVDRFMGDQVVGYFVPGFAGKQYVRRAIESGLELLRATGHGSAGEPWVPIGVGLNTGTAFIGTVGRGEDLLELTALGDDVTVAARLASVASAGELVCTERAYLAAGLDLATETRELALKGVSSTTPVRILTAGA
jgi:adenylate cyclase